MRTTVKISSQGKVTIPKQIRDEMGLEKGDMVELQVSEA